MSAFLLGWFRLIWLFTREACGSSKQVDFTKFLADKKGNVVQRFAPTTAPTAIEPQIEKLLAK